MMWTDRGGMTALRLSAGAFVAALVVAAFSVWDAWRIDPFPAPAAPNHAPTGATRPDLPTIPLTDVLVAVRADPFHPERRAPERRFSFGRAPDAEDVASAPGELRLIGTAVLPGSGGFALCALGTEGPRMVRLDEEVGPYRLTAIRPGEAEFVDSSGTSVTLAVPRGGGS